jgi:hypothetical protein
MMDQLLPQFERMRPGCRIVSHDYWIHGVEPEEVIEFTPLKDYHGKGIYLYVTPLKMNPDMEKGKPPRPAHR